MVERRQVRSEEGPMNGIRKEEVEQTLVSLSVKKKDGNMEVLQIDGDTFIVAGLRSERGNNTLNTRVAFLGTDHMDGLMAVKNILDCMLDTFIESNPDQLMKAIALTGLLKDLQTMAENVVEKLVKG